MNSKINFGETVLFEGIVSDASGEACTADEQPVLTVTGNAGVVDTVAMNQRLGADGVGQYTAQVQFDDPLYLEGPTFNVVMTAIVDGIKVKKHLLTFKITSERFESGFGDDGSPNTQTSFATYLQNTENDFYKDALIRPTSGPLQGQVKRVTAYDGTTKRITVNSPGFTDGPVDGDTFELVTA